MGAANSTMTTTELDARIPEVWANKMLGYLQKRRNLINTVTLDFDEEEIKNYGDIVNITKRGALTTNDKTEGQDVTLQKPSDTQVQVTLSNHKEITFSPSDVARAFSKPKVIDGYMEDAAQVLMDAVETSLAGEYANAGNTVNAGSAMDIADLRNARRILVTNKILATEPVYGYLDEYAIEDLPLEDSSKITEQAVRDGIVAKLGGVDIFESNAVVSAGSPTTYHDLVYTKDAIALVVRPLPTDAETFGGAKQGVVNDADSGMSVRVTMSYNADALAPQITLDVLWGVKTVRSEHLVDLYHTNA